MQIDLTAACGLLNARDDIVILAHRKPDGDTLGCAFALHHALALLGKRSRVECDDAFSPRYTYLYEHYRPEEFEPRFIVAVDVASERMLGGLREKYQGRVDLCIDHHKSNTLYARRTLLDAEAAATAQIMFEVIKGMGAPLDNYIADALFTGLSTDTGGFRYANVSAETHLLAAELIRLGADHVMINRVSFETRTPARLAVEKLALQSLEYYFDGKCALIVLPNLNELPGATEDDLDGISNLTRTIQGVLVGIAVRYNGDSDFRISMRSHNPVDVSTICARLGGGGHSNAAGCTMHGSLEEVKQRLLREVEAELSARLG